MELPFEPRPGQLAFIDILTQVQGKSGHGVIEAPTGSGKTVAALVASLTTIKANGGKVLFATRTNSQQKQVMIEHHKLRAAGQDPGLLVPLMGRRHQCPLLQNDAKFQDGSAEELGRLCRDAKRKAVKAMEQGVPVEGACPYYQKFLADGPGPVEALLRSTDDPSELGKKIATIGSCPYESLKSILPGADVVVLPLVYLVDEHLRNALCSWLGTGLDNCHIIIDEAHNLPSAINNHHSVRLGTISLQRAIKEAEGQRDPILGGRILSTSFLINLQNILQDLAAEFILDGQEDGKIPPSILTERLLENLRIPSPILEQVAIDLETWGDMIRSVKQEHGQLPRSYLGAVGTFLRVWNLTQRAPYAHLIEQDPLALEACLLESSEAAGWLQECRSTIHMSGTLTPLRDHMQQLGLPNDTALRSFASPFPASNLRIIGIEGIHRKWREHQENPAHANRLQTAGRRILKNCRGRTAIWFPSHAMLSDYLEAGFLHGIHRQLYRETPEMDHANLLNLVKKFCTATDHNSILLGVLGGRLTEGVDYPGNMLENILIMGIPYPRPSARIQAMIHHNDIFHDGKGWQLAVHNPVGRTLRQAVGRLVRGFADEGTAYILDERVVRFRDHLQGLWMVHRNGPFEVPQHQQEEFQLANEMDKPLAKTQLY